MADPTQPVRDLVKKGLTALIPENSPLAKSGESALSEEARAKMAQEEAARVPAQDEVSTKSSSLALEEPTTFVNPNQSSPATQEQAPMSMKVPSASVNGLNQEAAAIDKLGNAQAEVHGQLGKDYASVDKNVAALESQEESLVDKYNREKNQINDEISNFKREPHTIFSGKSTWQKVVGGIGMFLGSITPEGAKNVANIINTEIDRDIKKQEASLQLLKDKAGRIDSAYAQNMARFKDKKLAQLATKQNMLAAADLKLKQLESASKGELARAKATQGREEIAREMNKLQMEFDLKAKELGMKEGKGAINGFEGSNPNPAVVKEITEREAAAQNAAGIISQLQGLLKDGATMPMSTNKKRAEQLRDMLASEVAKAQAGGKYSDFEYAKAQDQIPDITSLMQRGNVDKNLLDGLLKQVYQNVDSYANAGGFRRKTVGTKK